jgi:hypothetical protein
LKGGRGMLHKVNTYKKKLKKCYSIMKQDATSPFPPSIACPEKSGGILIPELVLTFQEDKRYSTTKNSEK